MWQFWVLFFSLHLAYIVGRENASFKSRSINMNLMRDTKEFMAAILYLAYVD